MPDRRPTSRPQKPEALTRCWATKVPLGVSTVHLPSSPRVVFSTGVWRKRKEGVDKKEVEKEKVHEEEVEEDGEEVNVEEADVTKQDVEVNEEADVEEADVKEADVEEVNVEEVDMDYGISKCGSRNRVCN